MATLERPFARLGARVKVRDDRRSWRDPSSFALDIAHDRRGPYFDILLPESPDDDFDIVAVDVRPDLRHLLLLVRQDGRKDKFLCGHDERHWFTCAVPGSGVVNVRTALEALKPPVVRAAEQHAKVRGRDKLRRRNAAFVRQGEWFFVPDPTLVVPPQRVLYDEPISRGNGGKPHRLQEAFRTGGELVYVSLHFPRGLTEPEYKALLAHSPRMKHLTWTRMMRDAGVYARGRVSHGDHATITLPGWHRVLMNTEHEAPAARNVTFLD